MAFAMKICFHPLFLKLLLNKRKPFTPKSFDKILALFS